ncbi:hypothetical protein LCGC14_0547310 [marine sediment metagenome]|uniref:Uncharacterized protein n=1 Tax=marine sediment metagenome TaxID=412755 RepID=A0A0F9RVS0_9ZZZZ
MTRNKEEYEDDFEDDDLDGLSGEVINHLRKDRRGRRKKKVKWEDDE